MVWVGFWAQVGSIGYKKGEMDSEGDMVRLEASGRGERRGWGEARGGCWFSLWVIRLVFVVVGA